MDNSDHWFSDLPEEEYCFAMSVIKDLIIFGHQGVMGQFWGDVDVKTLTRSLQMV